MIHQFNPGQYLVNREERYRRSKPYAGMFISSSVSTTSDVLQGYSFRRQVQRRLSQSFALREGKRIELLEKSSPGANVFSAIATLKAMAEERRRYDFALVEIYSEYLSLAAFSGPPSELIIRSLVRQLKSAAQEAGIPIILIDTTPLYTRWSNGLYPRPLRFSSFCQLPSKAGLL